MDKLNPHKGPQKDLMESPYKVPLIPGGVMGRRTEGTLLKDAIQRITPKSPFLRKLERIQQKAKSSNVVPLKTTAKLK